MMHTLPDDILGYILSHVSLTELYVFLLCKDYTSSVKRLISLESFWKRKVELLLCQDINLVPKIRDEREISHMLHNNLFWRNGFFDLDNLTGIDDYIIGLSRNGKCVGLEIILASNIEGNYENALSLAALNGHNEVVKLLLQDPRVDPSADNNYAIRFASGICHVDVIKLLLQDPRVDPRAYNNYAIRYASAAGKVEIVKLLLQDKRIDPSNDDNYLIRLASLRRRVEVVKLLLQDNRVDPAANDNEAVRSASECGYVEVVKLLLQDRRVDPSANHNETTRHASQNRHLEVVKLLQDRRLNS